MPTVYISEKAHRALLEVQKHVSGRAGTTIDNLGVAIGFLYEFWKKESIKDTGARAIVFGYTCPKCGTKYIEPESSDSEIICQRCGHTIRYQ